MSENDITDEEAVEAVVSAADRNRQRLQRGSVRRAAMIKQLTEGQIPKGPRAEWLQETALALIRTLSAKTSEFDDANPDDKISVADFGDVLVTVAGQLGINLSNTTTVG